jgi:hypothetical protein
MASLSARASTPQNLQSSSTSMTTSSSS